MRKKLLFSVYGLCPIGGRCHTTRQESQQEVCLRNLTLKVHWGTNARWWCFDTSGEDSDTSAQTTGGNHV